MKLIAVCTPIAAKRELNVMTRNEIADTRTSGVGCLPFLVR